MSYLLKFTTTDDNVNNKIFPYDGSMTIENMLSDFLRKTNSKFTLDANAIVFQYHAFLLNKGDNLKKTVAEIFKKNTKNVAIKVTDYQKVIGGL